MKVVTLTQGSDEWLQWRSQGVGASDAPLFINPKGKHFDRTYDKFVLDWLNKTPSVTPSTWAMNQGKAFEEVARRWYEGRFNVKADPLCVEHDFYSFIRSSLDGYAKNSRVVIEIKYADRDSHRLALDKNLPAPKYEPQLWHQAITTGSRAFHYVSGNPRFDHHETICLVRYKPPQEKLIFLLLRLLRTEIAIRQKVAIQFTDLPLYDSIPADEKGLADAILNNDKTASLILDDLLVSRYGV